MDPQDNEEQSSHESSNINEEEPKQQALSPKQRVLRAKERAYWHQVDPCPKGEDGEHPYWGDWPLINTPFWLAQYQLDYELEHFPTLEVSYMSGWYWWDLHNPIRPHTTSPHFSIKQEVKAEDALRKHWIQAYKRTVWAVSDIQIETETNREFKHNPIRPHTTSPHFSIKQEVKAEDALRKHWIQAYKRTVWAVSDIQIETETKREFSYLPDWIGYSWHLCCKPWVIYKRALELQLLLLPFIDIYQAARYVIQDLHPQLYQFGFYGDLWNKFAPVCLNPTTMSTRPLLLHLFVPNTACLGIASETYQTLINSGL